MKSKKKKEAVIENNPENETITVPYLSVIKDTNLKSVLYQEGKSFKCIKCIGDLGNWMSLINGNPDDYDVECWESSGNGSIVQNRLKKAGLDRKDITKVIFSHFHPDHIGWTTIEENGKRVLTFPNAKYYS